LLHLTGRSAKSRIETDNDLAINDSSASSVYKLGLLCFGVKIFKVAASHNYCK
jgi:hypothetical protein